MGKVGIVDSGIATPVIEDILFQINILLSPQNCFGSRLLAI
ncbi:hypothetical protein [Candidatus Harpocratesius sp.]